MNEQSKLDLPRQTLLGCDPLDQLDVLLEQTDVVLLERPRIAHSNRLVADSCSNFKLDVHAACAQLR